MDEERLRKLTKDVKIYLSETNPPWVDVVRAIIEYLHENKLLKEGGDSNGKKEKGQSETVA